MEMPKDEKIRMLRDHTFPQDGSDGHHDGTPAGDANRDAIAKY